VAKSRLEQVLDAVQAAALVRLSGVTFAYGLREVESQTQAMPRVTWVRTTDAYQDTDPGVADNETVTTRGAVVVAHCVGAQDPARAWDTDEAATEAVVDAVVAALVDTLGPSVVLGTGEWLDTGHTSRGAPCLLSFTVLQPVTRTAPGVGPDTVVIESVDFDPAGASGVDGILQPGES
jgi:hypothetical protein